MQDIYPYMYQHREYLLLGMCTVIIRASHSHRSIAIEAWYWAKLLSCTLAIESFMQCSMSYVRGMNCDCVLLPLQQARRVQSTRWSGTLILKSSV